MAEMLGAYSTGTYVERLAKFKQSTEKKRTDAEVAQVAKVETNRWRESTAGREPVLCTLQKRYGKKIESALLATVGTVRLIYYDAVD